MKPLNWKFSGLALAVLALLIAALLLVNPAPDAAAQNALPELKITEGPAVPEGQGLTFTISATHPTLDRDLTVNVQVTEDTSQSRSYLRDSERGSKRAVIYAGMDTGTYTVKTVNDNNDEYDGAVTVTLRPGNGYTVGATNAATGTVTDTEGSTVSLIISNKAIAENGGKTDIVYNIDNGPLKAGQTIAFKTGVNLTQLHFDPNTARNPKGTVGTDWTLRLKPGADNQGVTLTSSGTVNGVAATAQNPIVTMTGAGAKVAVLELTAVDDSIKNPRQSSSKPPGRIITWYIDGDDDGIFVQALGSAAQTYRVGGGDPAIFLVDNENTDPATITFTRGDYSVAEWLTLLRLSAFPEPPRRISHCR